MCDTPPTTHLYYFISFRQDQLVGDEGLEKKSKKKRFVSKAFISDSDEEMSSGKELEDTVHTEEDTKQQTASEDEDE